MSLGRVLVVGGDGQLGAELRRRLAADAAQVLATTRSGRLADGEKNKQNC